MESYTFTDLAISIVFLRSCLNEARSDGVSILDTNEIPCLTLREAVEAVAEDAPPPVLDFFTMLRPESLKRIRSQRECGGIGPPGQCRGTQDATTSPYQVAAQIRQRSALTDEVVYEEIRATFNDRALEYGRTHHTLPSRRARMVHYIGLDDTGIHFQIESFGQQLGKSTGDPVVSQILEGMNRDKGRPLTGIQSMYRLVSLTRGQLGRQALCRRHVARLRRLVLGVLLYRAFGRRENDRREAVPGKPIDGLKFDDGRTGGPFSQGGLELYR